MCDQKWMIYKYIRSQFEAHSMGRVYRVVRFSYSNYLHNTIKAHTYYTVFNLKPT